MSVKIFADSVSDLPPQVAQELGIAVVPLNVRFGEEVYRDSIDLSTEQFYERLRHSRILPITSVPSPGTFAEAYDKLEYLRRGGHIGKAQPLLGSMLKANPIVYMKDRVVEPAGRTRSRAKVINHLHDFAASYSNIEEMAVEDTACPDDAELLVERLGSILPKKRIYRSRTTPVIGTHTGSRLLLAAIMGNRV